MAVNPQQQQAKAKRIVGVPTTAKQIPFDQYEFVSVEFPTAGVDVRVYHNLRPATPRDIVYIPLQKSCDCTIYDVETVSTWTPSSIVLRSNVGPAEVLFLLAVKKPS